MHFAKLLYCNQESFITLEEFPEVAQVLKFLHIRNYEESSKKVPSSFLVYKYISIIFFANFNKDQKD